MYTSQHYALWMAGAMEKANYSIHRGNGFGKDAGYGYGSLYGKAHGGGTVLYRSDGVANTYILQHRYTTGGPKYEL